jgi:hypothetical protein
MAEDAVMDASAPAETAPVVEAPAEPSESEVEVPSKFKELVEKVEGMTVL